MPALFSFSFFSFGSRLLTLFSLFSVSIFLELLSRCMALFDWGLNQFMLSAINEISQWIWRKSSTQILHDSLYKVNGYTDGTCKITVYELQCQVSKREATKGYRRKWLDFNSYRLHGWLSLLRTAGSKSIRGERHKMDPTIKFHWRRTSVQTLHNWLKMITNEWSGLYKMNG